MLLVAWYLFLLTLHLIFRIQNPFFHFQNFFIRVTFSFVKCWIITRVSISAPKSLPSEILFSHWFILSVEVVVGSSKRIPGMECIMK